MMRPIGAAAKTGVHVHYPREVADDEVDFRRIFAAFISLEGLIFQVGEENERDG